MKQEAYFCRVKELNELGKENIPKPLKSAFVENCGSSS